MHGSGCHPDASASAPLALPFTSTLPETICAVQATDRFLKPSHSLLEQGSMLWTATSSQCPRSPAAPCVRGKTCAMRQESPEKGCSPATVPLRPAWHPRRLEGGGWFHCTAGEGLQGQANVQTAPGASAELLLKLDFSQSSCRARVLLHLPPRPPWAMALIPPEPWACLAGVGQCRCQALASAGAGARREQSGAACRDTGRRAFP